MTTSRWRILDDSDDDDQLLVTKGQGSSGSWATSTSRHLDKHTETNAPLPPSNATKPSKRRIHDPDHEDEPRQGSRGRRTPESPLTFHSDSSSSTLDRSLAYRHCSLDSLVSSLKEKHKEKASLEKRLAGLREEVRQYYKNVLERNVGLQGCFLDVRDGSSCADPCPITAAEVQRASRRVFGVTHNAVHPDASCSVERTGQWAKRTAFVISRQFEEGEHHAISLLVDMFQSAKHGRPGATTDATPSPAADQKKKRKRPTSEVLPELSLTQIMREQVQIAFSDRHTMLSIFESALRAAIVKCPSRSVHVVNPNPRKTSNVHC